MSTPQLKVVQMREHTLRDVPAQLRALADRVEAGEHGQVGTCAVSILGDTLEVYAWGDESSGPAAALVFQAAIQRLANTIETHGK